MASEGRHTETILTETSQSNHTRTTASSNSMKLSPARGETQDGWVMVERSDRMWSTGEGNGKSLQSGPTLCDPIDSSPPGSSVSQILQARTLEWFAIYFSNA